MRILHTADLHLGKTIYGKSLLEDQKYFIDNCFFKAIEELKPDAVIIAGDIFDRAVAPAAAIAVFDDLILRLNKLNIPLFAVTGNHDGEDRITLGASLLRESGIYISVNPKDIASPVTISKDGFKYCFYMLPFTEPVKMRGYNGFEEAASYTDTYRLLIAEAKKSLDIKACNILISHCFVTGCTVSESESPIFIGGSCEISADVFSDFDYVALGHLHSPQKAGTNCRYSGSPLKYSFDEQKQNKSITVIDADEKNITTSVYNYTPLHNMKTVRGKFDDLLENGKNTPDNDYVFVELSDDVPIYMPVERLREYYPNILGLKSDYIIRKASQEKHTTVKRNSSDEEILSAFLTQICGTEMTKQDAELFAKAKEGLL